MSISAVQAREWSELAYVIMSEGYTQSYRAAWDGVMKLTKLARNLQRLNAVAANRTLTENEDAAYKRAAKDADRIVKQLVGSESAIAINTGPNACPLGIILPSGRTNNNGRDRWIVPF